MLVLVTGATGFLGRRVVQQLLERRHTVRCLVHTPGSERLFTDRSIEICYGSVNDSAALNEAMEGVAAVIHLVAVIRQGRGSTFSGINRRGVAGVAWAAKENGVGHFIHVSASGATRDSRYKYLNSKYQGEQEVKASNIPYTIFRPTLMFGPGDEVLTALAGIMRLSPFMPVGGTGRNRFQPIHVDDVARCLAMAVDRTDLKGKTVELGGPEQLSYSNILKKVAQALGKRLIRLPLPLWAMYPPVLLMELLLPRAALTVEMLKMLSRRGVSELGGVERTFGFTPKTLEGNIDFVKSVSAGDGMRTVLGLPPRRSW